MHERVCPFVELLLTCEVPAGWWAGSRQQNAPCRFGCGQVSRCCLRRAWRRSHNRAGFWSPDPKFLYDPHPLRALAARLPGRRRWQPGSETGSLETGSSSRESTNFRFLSIPPAADRGGLVLPLPMSVEGSGFRANVVSVSEPPIR